MSISTRKAKVTATTSFWGFVGNALLLVEAWRDEKFFSAMGKDKGILRIKPEWNSYINRYIWVYLITWNSRRALLKLMSPFLRKLTPWRSAAATKEIESQMECYLLDAKPSVHMYTKETL